MSYPGGKNGHGVWQRIINLIPPHRVYIEGCAGGAAVLRQKRPADISYAIDVDPAVIGGLADAVPGTILVEHDVIDWLKSYPFDGTEFVYLDPPYLRSTRRSKTRIYRHEFSRKQHSQLLTIIKRLPCPVMISGYQSPLYARRLAKWHPVHFPVMTHQGPAEEWLWMNYPRPARLHDYRYIGDTFRERQDLSRQRKRWSARFADLAPQQQAAILRDLNGDSADAAGFIGTPAVPAVIGGSADAAGFIGTPAVPAVIGGSADAAGFIGGVADGRAAADSAVGRDPHGKCADGRPSVSVPMPPGARDHSAATDAVTPQRQLVLSLFPGVDLLGRAFGAEGFCPVAGPDLITGGDIGEFVGVPGRFDGVIGGSPCQDFSSARRTPPTGDGMAMIREFLRVVGECRPTWFLLENVPRVPDVRLDGYRVQRVDLTDAECGGVQERRRHFQFGHREGWILRPKRLDLSRGAEFEPAATTQPNNGRARGRTFPALCRVQGLSRPLKLPGWTRTAKFKAVGNGVPTQMGLVLAQAVAAASPRDATADCVCGCGRPVTGQARHAGASCRKRMERRRRKPRRLVTAPG